jgi:hypothetical protein
MRMMPCCDVGTAGTRMYCEAVCDAVREATLFRLTACAALSGLALAANVPG